MTPTRHEEWRPLHEDTRYPFAPGALLTNGRDVLPTNFLLDARLWPTSGRGRCYLSGILCTPTDLTFEVSDGAVGQVGRVVVPSVSDQRVWHLTDDLQRSVGVFLFGNGLQLLRGWSEGPRGFTAAQTAFTGRAQAPTPQRGVQAFPVDNKAMDGEVWWVGEAGLRLGLEDGTIRFDARGEPLFLVRECFDADPDTIERFLATIPLRTISGIPSDPLGDFDILLGGQTTSEQGLRIEIIEHGIRIVGAA